MKKLIYPFICALLIFSSIAATVAYEAKNSTAEVEQYEGIFIFTDSKPVKEYDYLGTIKGPSITWDGGQYFGLRNSLIKKCKKDYPSANALILHPNNNGFDKADVIKFK